MKILITQKISKLSGSEWYLLNLSSGLLKKGIEVHFLALIDVRTIDRANDLVEMFVKRGIKVHRIEVTKDFSFKLFKSISDLIKREQYNFVHSNLIRTDFIISMVKLFYKRDLFIVSTHHGFDLNYQFKHGFNVVKSPFNLFIRLSRFNQKFINANIAISKGIKNLHVGHKTLKPEKMDVIPYGFQFENITYSSDINKYRKAPMQILIVGRLISWKGHKDVMDIMPNLIKRLGKDIALVIVGIGEYERELRNHARAIGIEKHVFFEGFSTKVHDYIKNSDVVAIPSRSEGFCVVLMEAYFSEGAIAAYDVPALNENIFHRETGMLATPYNLTELENNIVEILENPELTKNLKLNGKKYLEDYLNLERMTDDTIKFYKSKTPKKKALN